MLTTICTLPESPPSSTTAARLQMACLLFAAFFHGPPNHSNTSPKAIARGISGAPASTNPADNPGNFFVPADGNTPNARAPNTAEEDDNEPPSSLLQLLTEHLSLSMLARSKVADDAIESRLWDKVIVAYLILLSTWLWEDPKSVRIFLEAGGVGVVRQSSSSCEEAHRFCSSWNLFRKQAEWMYLFKDYAPSYSVYAITLTENPER
jgi:intracellular protein transport protein USO1